MNIKPVLMRKQVSMRRVETIKGVSELGNYYITASVIKHFWFPLVSKPKKPIKTNKNDENLELGNLCPFSPKPHISINYKNLKNQQKLNNLHI